MGEWTTATAVTALAQLPGVGPVRLDQLLRAGDPIVMVDRLARGGAPPSSVGAVDEAGSWGSVLAAVEPAALAARLADLDITVTTGGERGHPARLRDDLDPSPVLFRRGRPVDEAAPMVAIVGTRRCSAIGREVARELGFGLAAAGVVVVSGLALGVDGAAHAGALAAAGAPPLAFVGGGPDVVYPSRHGDLWAQVVSAGTLASEAPPGAAPSRWRFPARNRLIAAMADVVVVVESRSAGGSLLTVDEAIRRDRTVMAVPGSVRNPAAAGTNELLADGCAPVLGVDDILLALGLSSTPTPAGPMGGAPGPVPAHLRMVFDAVDDGPTSVDQITVRSARPVLEVVTAIAELVAGGFVVDDGARVRRA
ncbi:MAG: DNA-processing protein DprA [Actinomycetota bacterium]